MWMFVRTFSGGQKSSKELLRRIRKGQRALQVIRCRVAATWLLLALSTGILAEVYSAKCQAGRCLALPLGERRHVILEFIKQAVFESLFQGRLLLLGLAPLADDVVLTRLILLWDSFVFAFTRVSVLIMHQATVSSTSFGVFSLASFHGRGLIFIMQAVWATFQHQPERIQSWMWSAIGVYVVANSVDKVIRTIYEAVTLHAFSSCAGQIISGMLTLYLVWNFELRQSAQARLRGWLEGRASQRAAVTIACLMGGCRPSDAVAQASSRFRCVSMEALTFEDVKDNSPDPTLHELSFRAELGQCDAFLSHSWHDNAEAKWNALERWHKEFLTKEGREPLVWFDKVCIDQNNIDLDLRCLPIFLHGCKRLVILCGSTYLSRLWCITELFTYVHMGGKLDHIELIPVLREFREAEDLREVYDSFQLFDVRSCECFNAEDKDRMMVAISTAFGCMDRFNDVVHTISRQVSRSTAAESCLEESDSSSEDEGTSSEEEERDWDGEAEENGT